MKMKEVARGIKGEEIDTRRKKVKIAIKEKWQENDEREPVKCKFDKRKEKRGK